MHRAGSLAAGGMLALATLLAGCAADPAEGDGGLRIVRRTPDEFCRGTARSVALERYRMKREGVPLAQALEGNGGVAVIDAITRAVYSRDLRSGEQAADAGSSACQSYFRGR